VRPTERLHTPGAPGYEREHPAEDIQYSGSARVRTGAPVLYAEDKSGAPDYECVLGAVLSESRSGQDWMSRVLLRRYLYSHGGWLVGAYLRRDAPSLSYITRFVCEGAVVVA